MTSGAPPRPPRPPQPPQLPHPLRGWGQVAGSKSFHFCGPDGRSLCGRYGFLGFTQVDLYDTWHDHPLNCKICARKHRTLNPPT